MDSEPIWQELKNFFVSLFSYLRLRTYHTFSKFERFKDWLVDKLYKQRGRWARPFEHLSYAGLVILAILLAPIIAQSYSERTSDYGNVSVVLGVTTEATTAVSEKSRDEIVIYIVQGGDTVSTIAQKFGVSVDTIRWANNLKSITSIKAGQELKILPVTGVAHKVQRGETVWSIAQKYDTNSQGIVDYPFNTFVNDEEFTLAVGQVLIVPDGVMPKVEPWQPRTYIAQETPDAGTVVASGNFVWPASGRISQGFRWYHRAIDIANKSAPGILAADAGKVVSAGWPRSWGYGNRVVIDHGNGFQTLYAHLSEIYVSAEPGKNRVEKGQPIGKMGATGRATGIHLHFEVIKNGIKVNPLNYLK
jgi:murein DD-endopeptidase MepM/ murein hydrolase activator NlpD